MNIQDMSNRQLEELISSAQVELQDRQYRIYEDAITHGIYVGEVEEKYRDGYIEYLEHNYTDGRPAIMDILDDWHNQKHIIQSRKTTGA